MIPFGLMFWLFGNISAWFALTQGDYVYSLIYGLCAFAILLISVEIQMLRQA